MERKVFINRLWWNFKKSRWFSTFFNFYIKCLLLYPNFYWYFLERYFLLPCRYVKIPFWWSVLTLYTFKLFENNITVDIVILFHVFETLLLIVQKSYLLHWFLNKKFYNFLCSWAQFLMLRGTNGVPVNSELPIKLF